MRASGVDFCACSSFKWLMGDFGLGFLFVREELLDTVVRRSQIGYEQADTALHYLPSDPPPARRSPGRCTATRPGTSRSGRTAQGAVNALAVSLPYLRRLGVEDIQAYRQPMLRRLQQEMPRLGFTSITPPESPSALVAFTMRGAEGRFGDRLRAANVAVSLYGDRIRISPSLFNDLHDIETLLAALS